MKVLATLALLGAFLIPASSAAQSPDTPSLPDHQAFTEVLSQVVDVPKVDYSALKERRAGLDRYLETLASVDPSALESAAREEKLAFWINAYNACMLRLVVDHYPIQKQGGFFGRIRNAVADRPDNSVWQIDNVFTRDHCSVAGAARSQDEIEHEIIRPMEEPRIHFAVNCAARSCPPIRTQAYTPDSLDAQLDAAVRTLVDNPDHFRIEGGDPAVLRLNKVLDWYGEDFGGPGGLKTFFQDYVSEEEASILARPGTLVEYFDYDWTLNDTGS